MTQNDLDNAIENELNSEEKPKNIVKKTKIPENDKNSYVIYGDVGNGKTELALSSSSNQNYGKILHIGLKNTKYFQKEYPGVDFVQIKSLKQLSKLLENEENLYKTVILDDFSNMLDLILSKILKERNLTRPNMDIFNERIEETKNIILKLDRNFTKTVLIVLREDKTDESEGKMYFFPMLGGSLSKRICDRVNNVLFVKTVIRDDEKFVNIYTAPINTDSNLKNNNDLPFVIEYKNDGEVLQRIWS